MPYSTSEMLSNEIEIVLAENNVENEVEIKIEEKKSIPLGRGKCKGMILVKMNISIYIVLIDERFQYELDLREVPKDKTYFDDPVTRDFRVNSGYYRIDQKKVLDLVEVGSEITRHGPI